MMEGMSAVVFLQYLIPFPVEVSFHLLCAMIPGVVTSSMDNSMNACPLLSEMSKKCKR